MKLSDRLKTLGISPGAVTGAEFLDEDSFVLEAGADGVVRQPCWFCEAEVTFRPGDSNGDVALLMVEIPGPRKHLHGICHTRCVERSKGSLSAAP